MFYSLVMTRSFGRSPVLVNKYLANIHEFYDYIPDLIKEFGNSTEFVEFFIVERDNKEQIMAHYTREIIEDYKFSMPVPVGKFYEAPGYIPSENTRIKQLEVWDFYENHDPAIMFGVHKFVKEPKELSVLMRSGILFSMRRHWEGFQIPAPYYPSWVNA